MVSIRTRVFLTGTAVSLPSLQGKANSAYPYAGIAKALSPRSLPDDMKSGEELKHS